jgi:hypothetical protein
MEFGNSDENEDEEEGALEEQDCSCPTNQELAPQGPGGEHCNGDQQEEIAQEEQDRPRK